jgi:hypothetical protein
MHGTLQSALRQCRTKCDILTRRASGFLEHRVDGGLGTFFAVSAGHAHRAYHLAVDYDRQGPGLREVVHESRCQVLTAAHDLVHFRGGPAPAEGRFRERGDGEIFRSGPGDDCCSSGDMQICCVSLGEKLYPQLRVVMTCEGNPRRTIQ